jgi:S-adenosylmethionine synthetase
MEGARGVSDTVVVHGYATAETREMLPRPLVYAHALARRLDDLRKNDPAFAWLRPDGKVQLVVEKDQVRAVTVLASHDASVNPRDAQTTILDRIVTPVVGETGAQIFINPIGSFTTFGFQADSGASGRKTATDTYGALVPHGDSHLSGKDPFKAERAGAYMARFAARRLVEQGLASSAFVTVAYTLGRAEPVHVEASGVGKDGKKDLTAIVKEQFDFRPEAIVEQLGLARPIFQATATYGHFGREEFPWES